MPFHIKNHDSLIEDEPIINCKDLGIDEFDFQSENCTLPLFHQNITSLEKHKDNLENMLNCLNFSFDIIGLSESRSKKIQLLNLT